MGQLIGNTIRLGASLAVSILCGLVTAKVVASTLGPHGYGIVSLYGSFIAALVLLAGLGISNALTRSGAAYTGDPDSWRELRAAAFALTVAAWVLASIAVILFHHLVGTVLNDPRIPLGSVIMLLVAGLGTLGLNLENAIMKTEGRVRTLARADALTSLVVGGTVVGLIHMYGTRGILPAMALGGLLGWGILLWHGEGSRLGDVLRRVTRPRILLRMRQPLRLGTSYGLSSLAGASVRLALPFIILHRLGTADFMQRRRPLQARISEP